MQEICVGRCMVRQKRMLIMAEVGMTTHKGHKEVTVMCHVTAFIMGRKH